MSPAVDRKAPAPARTGMSARRAVIEKRHDDAGTLLRLHAFLEQREDRVVGRDHS